VGRFQYLKNMVMDEFLSKFFYFIFIAFCFASCYRSPHLPTLSQCCGSSWGIPATSFLSA